MLFFFFVDRFRPRPPIGRIGDVGWCQWRWGGICRGVSNPVVSVADFVARTPSSSGFGGSGGNPLYVKEWGPRVSIGER